MAKITITLEDVEDGEKSGLIIGSDVLTDQPLDQQSLATRWAVALINIIVDHAKKVDVIEPEKPSPRKTTKTNH